MNRMLRTLCVRLSGLFHVVGCPTNVYSCLRLLLVRASTALVLRSLLCYEEAVHIPQKQLWTSPFQHGTICHVHADLLDEIDIKDVVDEWRDSEGILVKQNQVAQRAERNNRYHF